MKRIISILLVLIMVFSLTTSAYAGRIHFTESDRARYDVDAYYEHVFDNFNNLFEFTPWPFLTQDELFAYRGFVRNMEQNAALRLMLPSGLWVTGESATVERYIEILVNFMMLMQHDLNEIHNHMAEADALKTFWDYAADVGSIVMNSLKVADSVNRFGQLAYSTFNVAKDCISSYRLLSKMLLDFENQYHFLTVIIRYANNDNLVAAARVLRNNAERIMEYRMNFFIENSYRIAEYIGRDVLIDVVVMEIITNPEHLGQLGLSAVDQFALKSLADGYKALNTMLAAVHVARGLGVFAADMLAGISNVFNRVVEIRAMYDINRALITSAENLRRNVRSANDIDTIERVVGNMRYMLWVNARGDYLLYQMAMYDGQLLSLLFTDRQTTRNWYALVQTMFQNLVSPIEFFWPEREWFMLDNADADVNHTLSFHNFLANERLLIGTNHEVNIETLQTPWGEFSGVARLDLAGTINYKIADFDSNGRDKLLLIHMSPITTANNYVVNAIFAHMYEVIGGVVTMVDSHMLMLKELSTSEEWIDVFIKNVNGVPLIIAERQASVGPILGGGGHFSWNLRALRFNNGRFIEVVNSSLSGQDIWLEIVEPVQREMSAHGIMTTINPLFIGDFDDGWIFNRIARNSGNVEIICHIVTTNEIDWDNIDIINYWETGIIPPMPPIRIRFSR